MRSSLMIHVTINGFFTPITHSTKNYVAVAFFLPAFPALRNAATNVNMIRHGILLGYLGGSAQFHKFESFVWPKRCS